MRTAQNETTVSTVLSAKTMTRSPRSTPRRDQSGGQGIGALVELAVGEPLPLADQRDLVGQALAPSE